MAIVNKTSYHGNLTYDLQIIFVTKSQEKKFFFHVFWTVVLFSENIETNYIVILPLKKIQIMKVAAGSIMQYQPN